MNKKTCFGNMTILLTFSFLFYLLFYFKPFMYWVVVQQQIKTIDLCPPPHPMIIKLIFFQPLIRT